MTEGFQFQHTSNVERGQRWGPSGRRAAVSLTLDNLGETAELQMGLLGERRLGRSHPSIRLLPKVFRLFDEVQCTVTYFVEGENAEIYPDVVKRIADAGHEVAYHGWQHDPWGSLAPDEELTNLTRGLGSMGNLGVEMRGLRPPGGRLTNASAELLKRVGMRYASPAGNEACVEGGVVLLPFRWRTVDAFFYLTAPDVFRELRVAHGLPAGGQSPETFMQAALEAVDATVAAGGYLSIVLHPWLMEDEGRFRVVEEIVRVVASNDDIWCAPCVDVSNWILDGAAG